jgi:benzoylformate decarboxylase
MYTIQALWTAAHEKLAIVFIVLNNRSYRILKQNMITFRGATNAEHRFLAMDLDDPVIDYPGLARSMGIDAVAVDTLDGLSAQIAEGIAANRPVLIDVALDGAV